MNSSLKALIAGNIAYGMAIEQPINPEPDTMYISVPETTTIIGDKFVPGTRLREMLIYGLRNSGNSIRVKCRVRSGEHVTQTKDEFQATFSKMLNELGYDM